jgi:transposase
LTTKIHAVVDALGNPLRFILTPGQASDYTKADELISDLPADYVLADKGYDSKAFRDTIESQNAVPVIPPPKDIATSPVRRRAQLRTKPRRTLLPQNQALQANRNPLRTDPQGIPIHPLPDRRIHMDKVNVNAP